MKKQHGTKHSGIRGQIVGVDVLSADGTQNRQPGKPRPLDGPTMWTSETLNERILHQAQSSPDPMTRKSAIAAILDACERDIRVLAQEHNWKTLGDRARGFARIVTAGCIGTRKEMSMEEAAQAMGMKKQSYHETWAPRVKFVRDTWIQDWKRRN